MAWSDLPQLEEGSPQDAMVAWLSCLRESLLDDEITEEKEYVSWNCPLPL